MTESPLGRQNGGPRRRKRKARGCALTLLAVCALLVAGVVL